MAGSRFTTFVTLVAVSWALLAAWIGLFLSGGPMSFDDDGSSGLAFVLAPGLPFLAGAIWSSVSRPRQGVFVWPVVVTVGVWQLLLLMMLIVLALPLIGAAAGAHTGLSRGPGRLAPAVPLVAVGLAVTWATAAWLCRRAPACVPSANGAYMSLFGCGATVVIVFSAMQWQAHAMTEDFRARDAAFAVEVKAADALVEDLKKDPPDAAEKMRRLAQMPAGYDRVRRFSVDGTIPRHVRAQAIAQMLATYKDVNQVTDSGAAEMLEADDPEIRLLIVDALPATPFSEPSVPLLGSVLDDPDARVRMRASIKLVSINRQRHQYWDQAYRELQTLLQTLPDNPSIGEEDVRCGLYRLSITANDMMPLLDYILEDPALSPRHRTMMTNWRTFMRDPSPDKVAPRELYDGCA